MDAPRPPRLGQSGAGDLKVAFMNQEKKAIIAAELKRVMPKGWKYSLSVENHSAIVCTVSQAPVDLIEIANELNRETAARQGNEPYQVRGYFDVNLFSLERYDATPAGETFRAIDKALRSANWYDRSDTMTDYFDTAYHTRLRVGRWDKPFSQG